MLSKYFRANYIGLLNRTNYIRLSKAQYVTKERLTDLKQEEPLDEAPSSFLEDDESSITHPFSDEVLMEGDMFPPTQLEIKKKKERTTDFKKNKSKPKKSGSGVKFESLNAKKFVITAKKGLKTNDIPKLKFGLDRALFNPGVTYLKDPNSGIYNFDPYLENIMDVEKFNFDKVIGFIPASKDEKLLDVARRNKKKFTASTSSISHVLCHLTFVITNWRGLDTSFLGQAFSKMTDKHSRTLTYPASVRLIQSEDGIYSINADKTFDSDSSVLSKLGQVMERMLTQTPDEFISYQKSSIESLGPNVPSVGESELNTYNYSLTENFALRSQLDCQDPRLPNKLFDLKTRATLPIRMDIENYKDYEGYQLKTLTGKQESFEREYYDLMRSAFLKYSFQVRIGHMDGCFVAYHNCNEIFGFQYLSLKEMDQRMFGNSVMGNQVFGNSLKLLDKILTTLTKEHPDKDILLTFKSLQDSLILDVYAEFYDKATGSNGEIGEDGVIIDPQNPITKYQLVCYSTINGQKVLKPVSLQDEDDDWEVHYHLRKVKMDQLDLYNDYVALRNLQAGYFSYARDKIPWLRDIRIKSQIIAEKLKDKKNDDKLDRKVVYKPYKK